MSDFNLRRWIIFWKLDIFGLGGEQTEANLQENKILFPRQERTRKEPIEKAKVTHVTSKGGLPLPKRTPVERMPYRGQQKQKNDPIDCRRQTEGDICHLIILETIYGDWSWLDKTLVRLEGLTYGIWSCPLLIFDAE